MIKLKEKWLKKWFNKEISKTEMYFINDLDEQFEIKQLRSKNALGFLMNGEISEISRFVKNRQGYTLNKMGNRFLVNTPCIWFQLKIGIKETSILKFMNQNLKQIN